jgi:hypothetical protein
MSKVDARARQSGGNAREEGHDVILLTLKRPKGLVMRKTLLSLAIVSAASGLPAAQAQQVHTFLFEGFFFYGV